MRRIDLPLPATAERYEFTHRRDEDRLREPNIVSQSSLGFLEGVLGRKPEHVHYLSDITRFGVDDFPFETARASLLVQTVHQCFARHVGLRLSPAVIWYAVVHEVAQCVKLNPDAYGTLFTRTPGEKTTLRVRANSHQKGTTPDWLEVINAIHRDLRAPVLDEAAALFLPNFSTATYVDSTALLAGFMNLVSPYYEFEFYTCCGIPTIELAGTPEDWWTIVARARILATTIDELQDYFEALVPVLTKIALAADGETDQQFWRDIYKVNSMSGGTYVNGWINTLFAFTPGDQTVRLKRGWHWDEHTTTEEFPSHVSTVPFKWINFVDDVELDLTLVSGVLGVDYIGECLEPRLGVGVLQMG